MNLQNDPRVILSLDAGGTNLVFSAMKAGKMVGNEIVLPAKVHTLDEFLDRLTDGFEQVKEMAGDAHAISFAFPGPADYPKGIIGDLENLPVFRGGIALGPYLVRKFKIPVFINNDGDLFTLGEAMGGFLPLINAELKKNGNPKRYKQLIGATFGTGYGGGFFSQHNIITGDNSAGGEINRMGNILYPEYTAEESVSIRGVKRVFAREAHISAEDCPEPFDIYKIAKGDLPGNQEAALMAFKELAIVAADSLANSITLFDAPVVIGGGLSGAHDLILPTLVEELNKSFKTPTGKGLQRMEVFAYNWNHPKCYEDFVSNNNLKIKIPRTTEEIEYDPIKKVTIGVSQLGTGAAVALGAYAFAIQKLDGKS